MIRKKRLFLLFNATFYEIRRCWWNSLQQLYVVLHQMLRKSENHKHSLNCHFVNRFAYECGGEKYRKRYLKMTASKTSNVK